MEKVLSKDDVVHIMSTKLKLVRVERGLSQEKMAEVLGLSKKTLVQIEKGRIPAGWTVCIAAAALFPESEIVQSSFGGHPLEVIQALVFTDGGQVLRPQEKTLGGKVWWTLEKQLGTFRLQRNIISGHYRILDTHDFRWLSSFDRDFMLGTLAELAGKFK